MRPVRSTQGFALLITITLLAFLVLLLVSLATFTRVETQVAGNAQQLSQARQNAMAALSLALGRLQELAGPDQRATATAEIDASDQDGTRLWTGVWGNENTSDDYVSSPKLLGWLVSGNETDTFEAADTPAAFGRITTASTPTHSPSQAVDLGDAVTIGPLSTAVELNGSEARLLVGPGSVAERKNYVIAPLREITVAASTVPGLGGSDPVSIGRYAWWVGDEGVKARINLVDPKAGSAATAQERFHRLRVAQRHGIELMTTDGTSPFGPTLYDVEGSGTSSTRFRDELKKTLSYPQISLLPGFGTAALDTALSLRRHDLTVASRGVLADQLRGGLRRDLTVLLDADPASWTGALKTSLDHASATYAGARRIADFQSSRLYGADYSMDPSRSVDARSSKAATWEQVRSFHHYATTNTGTVDIAAQTDSQMAISPLVVRWGVSFDVSVSEGGEGLLHFFPYVVLWNPYNVTLNGGYRVRLEFASIANSTATRLYFLTPRLDDDGLPIDELPYTIYHQELFAGERPGTGKYSQRTLEFAIHPVAIPAGEAYVFTPQATQPYQTSGDNWLTNAYGTSASFTRAISHAFTPAEIEDTALALANIDDGNGGTMSLHLLDASGNALQLIDAPGLPNSVTVDNNDGTATQVTAVEDHGLNEFRELSSGPVSARHHTGFAFFNALQGSSPSYNWLAQVNQRAPSIGRTWFEWSSGLASTANWTTTHPRANVSTWTIDVDPSDPRRTYTGPSHGPSFTTGTAPSAVTRAILFHLPQADTPVLSLGQLQHAALTFASAGHEPTYAFGNAYATPHIRQDRLLNPNPLGLYPTGSGSEAHLTDVSYLLNRALWDRFFFSGTPDVSTASLQTSIDAGEPLPDGRIRYLGRPAAVDVRDFDRAAAHLMVDGMFNVNSTSVEAWTALFASLRGVQVNPANGAAAASMNGTPYVRTPYAPDGSDTGSPADQWAGYRALTDRQVRLLASAMRDEVVTRGPFLSLADFVNRRLVSYPDATGLSGALQAVIDRVSLAEGNGNGQRLNWGILERDRPPSGGLPAHADETWTVGSSTYYLQNIKAPRRGSPNTARSKGAMAPGFLSQADMLQALGSSLAARSDTFTIRAYGETVNPLLSPTDSGYITGRAWCEAVVQRLPEYVDPANAAEVRPVTGANVNLTADNQRFGRRFEVVSFRWLNPADI